MNANANPHGDEAGDTPLTSFYDCHAGFLSRLNAFAGLPALLTPAAQAHTIAQESLHFFSEAIFVHHSEEERELFAAVLASAAPGEERERVQSMVERLTREHRQLEALLRLASGATAISHNH